MERLQKKCFVGSLASHAILVGVLAMATAFGSRTFKPIDKLQSDPEKYIPIKLIDVDALTDGESRQGGGGGGGSPVAPPAAAPVPQPAPPPAQAEVKPPQVEPVAPPPAAVEIPKPPPMEAVVVPPQQDRTSLRPPENNKKKAEKTEPKKEAKAETKKEAPKIEPKKVAVNLNQVDRTKSDASAKLKAAAEAERQKKAADAQAIRAQRARQNQLATINGSINALQQDISQSGGGLDIASFGAGSGKGWGVGSGPTLMNYAQYVREIYDLNWIVPDGVVGDSGVVRVEIVVQRNGAARGKIVKSSGNAQLDRTVQKALDNVKNIGRPFPEGATDTSRTFTINFNLSSKRGTG